MRLDSVALAKLLTRVELSVRHARAVGGRRLTRSFHSRAPHWRRVPDILSFDSVAVVHVAGVLGTATGEGSTGLPSRTVISQPWFRGVVQRFAHGKRSGRPLVQAEPGADPLRWDAPSNRPAAS